MSGDGGHNDDVEASRLVSPVLVGRGRELSRLLAAVAAPPSLAVVTGESGIGKSRLIAELLAQVQSTGATVLVGRGYRIQEPFPFGPFLEAVRSLGERVGALALSKVAGALRPLLPELADQLPEPLEPLSDAAAERHRVFRALAEVLGRVGPAVLVLEDLHWADSHSLDMLGFLLHRHPATLALVASYRSDEAPERLRALTARAPAPVAVVRIGLRPLEVPQTRELASAILQTRHISTEFAAFLHERTGGLPFAIEELLAVLRERGEVARLGQRWARRELALLAVPNAIRDAVLERYARLPAPARVVVDAAAVLQVPSPEHVIQDMTGLSGSEATAALSAAIASGLLTDSDRRIGFRHVLAAQAVAEALPGPHRRALHARAADALAALEPCPVGQLAHHLGQAGRLDEWAHYAELAADRAAAVGDDAGAATLLSRVLTDAPLDPARRAAVAGKLARVALYGVCHEDALGPLCQVLQRDDLRREDRGELRRGIAQLLAQSGDEMAAYEQLQAAVVDLEGRPASQARVMAALAVLNVPGCHADRIGWADRARKVLAGTRDPAAETVVLGNRTLTLLSAGDPSWRECLAELGGEAASMDHRRLLVRVAYNLGITACYMGHLRDADRLLREAAQHLQQCGGELNEHAVRSAEVVLRYRLGTWDGLAELVDELCDEVVELPVHRVDVEWVAGSLRLARGDLSGSCDHLSLAWNLCDGLTSMEVAATVMGTLARVHLARGDVSEAVTGLMRFVEAADARDLWVPAGRAVCRAVETLVAAGDLATAVRLADTLRDALAHRDAPEGHAARHLADGAIAEAEGKPDRAAAAYLAAAESYGTMGDPYEAAQAGERAAACLFTTDGDRAARVLLSALEQYERLGASWDAARAARAARRNGLTLPTPYRGGRRGYGADLSPRERDVARLAAAGLSNSEIAEQLFLSVRTVEKHVSRALRKLGAASRRDLRFVGSDLVEGTEPARHPRMGA